MKSLKKDTKRTEKISQRRKTRERTVRQKKKKKKKKKKEAFPGGSVG